MRSFVCMGNKALPRDQSGLFEELGVVLTILGRRAFVFDSCRLETRAGDPCLRRI